MVEKRLKKKVVIVTCGVAVTGKTAFALGLARLPDTTVIHKDRIYGRLGVSNLLPASEAIRDQAETQMLTEIKNALSEHGLVVVDVALVEKYRRLRVLTEIQKLACACVLVVFPVPSPRIAIARLARKKRMFQLTDDPVYAACRIENFTFALQRFEKPTEAEISRVVAGGGYIEFGNTLDETIIRVNRALFSSWRGLESQILEAYKAVRTDR